MPTSWSSNVLKDVGVKTYSDPTVTYDAPATAYTSTTADASNYGESFTNWSFPLRGITYALGGTYGSTSVMYGGIFRMTDSLTSWKYNVLADLALILYSDSATQYSSSTQTYNSLTAGQSSFTTELPTAWQ